MKNLIQFLETKLNEQKELKKRYEDNGVTGWIDSISLSETNKEIEYYTQAIKMAKSFKTKTVNTLKTA